MILFFEETVGERIRSAEMSKKIIISVVSILTVAILIAGLVFFIINRQNERKLQNGLQIYAIEETDDIVIENYSNNIGLWNDQFLNISTQKDFDRFVAENIMVPVTVTDESDTHSNTDPEITYHVISFEYANGNQKIYGRFSMHSNSDINYVSLIIYG